VAAVSANVHASCVRLGRAGRPFGASPDAGVLLLGGSGSGKSDLALRLIALGAELVADDRTDLYIARGRLYARAPRRIAGLIEVRGIGILEFPHVVRVKIVLAVELGKPVARLPAMRRYRPPLTLPRDAAPPLVRIAPFEASAAAKVIAAAAACPQGLFYREVNPI
jgi:HPr kinase/phosphorylase